VELETAPIFPFEEGTTNKKKLLFTEELFKQSQRKTRHAVRNVAYFSFF
jgi:hypothetical protein